MNNKMNANMTNEMKKIRGEMQQIGRGLQAGTAGIKAMARDETRTTVCKMAAPRGDTIEPARGSVDCVGPAVEAGEDQIIRETCWGRLVKVTVTDREKLNGVTETRHEVTTMEVKCTETREIEGRLHGKDGVEEDAHTHTQR